MHNILDGITHPATSPVPLTNPTPHAPAGMVNRVRVAVQGPDGEIKQMGGWVENVMNTFGLASLASMVGSGAGVNASTLVSSMRIGTGGGDFPYDVWRTDSGNEKRISWGTLSVLPQQWKPPPS